MRRLIVLAATCAALAACGSGSTAQTKGTGVSVDRNPFRVTLQRDGKDVVAQDRDARLRYQLRSNGEQHKLTKVISSKVVTGRLGSRAQVYEVATDEPGRTATVTIAPIEGGQRLSLRLHPETDVQQVYDAFDTGAGEHFLGGGERGGSVDLRGQILQVEVAEPCSYAPVPYFASSAGWGVRLDTHVVSALAFPGSAGGTGCRLGDGPACGFPPLAKRAEVCVQGARLDEDLYAGSLAELLRTYEAYAGGVRVPPASELELVKWRDAVAGPQEILDDVTRLQAAGIPLGWMLLDNPWETCMGELTFDRNRIPDPADLIRQVHARGVRFMLWVSPKAICDSGYPPSAFLGTPEHRTLDLRQATVRREFQSRLRRVFALGVDGVKGDRADEVDLKAYSPSLQNEYPLLFQHAVLRELPRQAGGMFRAATWGSQAIVPGLWAGDQSGDWDGLQRAIRAAQTAGMSGFPVWGSDVGGYQSSGLTGDVFARWAQLGAISPLLEVGGIGPNATPWTLGPAGMAALRDNGVLHYELFPYLYGLLRAGEPVLRPLGYGYPDDSQAWRAELELLVGPDLLAAPVVGPGTTPSVYLPEGRWVDLFTGAAVEGGRAFTRATPMNAFPLYARAGAVVPFNLRTGDSWWGVDEQTHPGRAGYLATNGSTLALRGEPHDVQIFVPAPRRPGAVTIGGDAVPWTWNAGPLPGAVIRVHGPVVEGKVALSHA